MDAARKPFVVRTQRRSAPTTTLAVVTMTNSSTATPEPTRVLSRWRTWLRLRTLLTVFSA